jgi:esterase/lipase superfamily enzyme
MFGYGGDRARARIAAPFLVEMLKLIATELPDVKLHIIAHSTGAEIALSALDALATTSAPYPKFGELILSHADLNPARLARVVPRIKTLGVGVTSYSSTEDWAMWISHTI